MHECPICGQACDCDGDDTWMDAPANCACDHEGSGYEDDVLYEYEHFPDDNEPYTALSK